jgi:ubiquinone/menaquinone biosynthesis C-methylase UbiE
LRRFISLIYIYDQAILKDNYDYAALFYDRLARLVYGRTLIDAQRYLLPAIPAGARVLIAGGGTGSILEEIALIHPSGLIIDYAEASSGMIERAKKRDKGNNEVNFTHSRVEEMAFASRMYDVVITPFFFDNFSDAAMRKIFSVLDSRLKQDGAWLYCDFRETDKARHKFLLRTMYIFFRWWCGVEAKKLPDMADCFLCYYYHPVVQTTFMKGFVESAIYKRV